MNILIAYCSKSGTTKTCAELLAKELRSLNVTLADLNGDIPGELTEYDIIVLGTYIRMGLSGKSFNNFIKAHANTVKNSIHGFFVCCGSELSFNENLSKIIPAELYDTAFGVEYFGGRLDISQQKGFFDKLAIRMIRASINNGYDGNDAETKSSLPTIAEPVIAQYAQKIMSMPTKHAK